MRISSKGKYNFFENEKNQGKKVKNLINAILNSVEPTKGDSSGRDSKGR